MTVEAAVNARLRAFPGLSALVDTRVRPMRAAQNEARPYVTFQRISASRVQAMGADPGVVRARVQVDVWADAYDDAKDVAEQVRLALQRWRQSGPPVVQDTFFLNEQDFSEDNPRIYRVSMDFEIIYEE